MQTSYEKITNNLQIVFNIHKAEASRIKENHADLLDTFNKIDQDIKLKILCRPFSTKLQ